MNMGIFAITQERKELESYGSHYQVAYYLESYCEHMGGCKRIVHTSHPHTHTLKMSVDFNRK